MLEPKTFAKESKQYQFFRKLWEFGTFEVFIILAARSFHKFFKNPPYYKK